MRSPIAQTQITFWRVHKLAMLDPWMKSLSKLSNYTFHLTWKKETEVDQRYSVHTARCFSPYKVQETYLPLFSLLKCDGPVSFPSFLLLFLLLLSNNCNSLFLPCKVVKFTRSFQHEDIPSIFWWLINLITFPGPCSSTLLLLPTIIVLNAENYGQRWIWKGFEHLLSHNLQYPSTYSIQSAAGFPLIHIEHLLVWPCNPSTTHSYSYILLAGYLFHFQINGELLTSHYQHIFTFQRVGWTNRTTSTVVMSSIEANHIFMTFFKLKTLQLYAIVWYYENHLSLSLK